MPIYEYVCTGCGSKFELLRSLSRSDEEATCPECSRPAHRKMSTFACFTTTGGGVPTRVAGTGNSCSSCGSGSCSSCGH